MKAAKIVSGVLSIFVTMPIWYYLMYQILVRVEASELMFFLYWVYVPVTVLAQIIAKVTEGEK